MSENIENKQPLISIGNCGEYLVAGELERRGFTVAVPMSNAPDFDILAINRETKKQIAIQVKTVKGSKSNWTLNKKNENLKGDNIFYVFVKLNGLDVPDYYVVPSDFVAKTITAGHKEWLDTPGIKGQQHNDNNMRKFSLADDKFKSAWNLLK